MLSIQNGMARVRIYPDDDHRFLTAFEYSLTWNCTSVTCYMYYVGNFHGGSKFSHNPRETLIEGLNLSMCD